MKTKILVTFIVALNACLTFAQRAELRTFYVGVKHGLELRVGELTPQGTIKGDVLYFHGFGDRLDNHMPLFQEWAKKGFRVIGFDLPSHGKSRGLFNNLDFHSFEEIIEFAEKIERATRRFGRRPLLLAGWSTGGLIVVRAAQTGAFRERIPSGLVLFAPAVSVPALVGRKGIVTEESLTRNPNPPHMGPPSPESPLFKPIFASKLLANAMASNHSELPHDLPVLTVVAGEKEDLYVKSPNVRKWALEQRWGTRTMRPAFQCEGAFHELDNEPGVVGEVVRKSAVEFSEAVIQGKEKYVLNLSGPCFSL